MPFGAALTFDPQTETALRGLWQAQADAGLPAYMLSVTAPPHMTLMMAEDLPADHLRSALAPVVEETGSLAVNFLNLGVFAAEFGVVYLAPVVNTALLDLHAAFWRAAAPLAVRPGDHYRPGVWVPHVTLAFALTPEQIGPVTAFLARQPWPRSGMVTSILFGEFTLNGPDCLEAISLRSRL